MVSSPRKCSISQDGLIRDYDEDGKFGEMYRILTQNLSVPPELVNTI